MTIPITLANRNYRCPWLNSTEKRGARAVLQAMMGDFQDGNRPKKAPIVPPLLLFTLRVSGEERAELSKL